MRDRNDGDRNDGDTRSRWLSPHLQAMHLTFRHQTAALTRLLRDTIDDDRYPLSPRIRLLQAVLDQLDPPPVREAPPPLKTRDPPRSIRADGDRPALRCCASVIQIGTSSNLS
jgi:hypothetical protein